MSQSFLLPWPPSVTGMWRAIKGRNALEVDCGAVAGTLIERRARKSSNLGRGARVMEDAWRLLDFPPR